jgi:hypothetical protein
MRSILHSPETYDRTRPTPQAINKQYLSIDIKQSSIDPQKIG